MDQFPAVVLCRYSSTRLPGKVLTDLCGKPMLDYTLDTLVHSKSVSEVVIATSDDESDDPIAEHARQVGIECIRGDLSNVSSRFLCAMSSVGDEAVFRVNGDSPLVNRELFSRAAETFDRHSCDLVTNVMPRTFPPGMSVELVNVASYELAYSQFDSPESYEHVTHFLYKHADQFDIKNIESNSECSSLHAAVDTVEDLELVRAVVSGMDRNHWEYSVNEILDLLRKEVCR